MGADATAGPSRHLPAYRPALDEQFRRLLVGEAPYEMNGVTAVHVRLETTVDESCGIGVEKGPVCSGPRQLEEGVDPPATVGKANDRGITAESVVAADITRLPRNAVVVEFDIKVVSRDVRASVCSVDEDQLKFVEFVGVLVEVADVQPVHGKPGYCVIVRVPLTST